MKKLKNERNKEKRESHTHKASVKPAGRAVMALL